MGRWYNLVMNTLTLKKQAMEIRKFIKKGSRMLLEFEVAQSQWEYKHGLFKSYKTGKAAVKAALKG